MDDDTNAQTMSLPASRVTGNQGESAVEHFFTMLGHSAGKYPPENDVGTDVFVDLRKRDPETGDAIDLGCAIRCQVKTGASWFSEKGALNGESGWYFRCNRQHIAYWTSFTERFLLILVSSDFKKMYWQWLDLTGLYLPVRSKPDEGIPEDDSPTNWKLFIPESNIVDESFNEYLLDYAKRHREYVKLTDDFDGYNFEISKLSESSWARYALMLPELTAPHPNRGFYHPITWAEAVALCAINDPSRWSADTFPSFSEEFEAVPNISEASAHEAPGWRFASAYRGWRCNGDRSAMDALSSLTPSLKAAVAVLKATGLYRNGRFQDAIEVLENCSALPDVTDPVDRAWLELHRGNCLCELSRWGDARHAYTECERLLIDQGEDKTARLIRNASSVGLINASEPAWDDSKLSRYVSARDNELTRFSLRRSGNALDQLFRDTARDWGLDNSLVIRSSNTVLTDFCTAANVSLTAGDVPLYRLANKEFALSDLRYFEPDGKGKSRDLFMLLSSGDSGWLAWALKRLRQTDDPSLIASFANSLSPTDMTPSTYDAYLKAVEICGAYLAEKNVSAWVDCLMGAFDNSADFRAKYGHYSRSTRPYEPAIRCLSAMRYLLTDSALVQLCERLASPAYGFDTVGRSVVSLLQVATEHPACASILRERAECPETPQWLRDQIDRLANEPTEEALAAYHGEIACGNFDHIDRIPFDDLSDEEVGGVVEHGLGLLRSVAKQHQSGVQIEGADCGGSLTATFLLLGRDPLAQQHWHELVDFLSTPVSSMTEKSAIVKLLLAKADEVPDYAVRYITESAELVRNECLDPLTDFFGTTRNERTESLLLAMECRLQGSQRVLAERLQQGGRLDATDLPLLRYVPEGDFALLSYCQGWDPGLWHNAFLTLVRICMDVPTKYAFYYEFIERHATHGGMSYTAAFLNAALEAADTSEETRAILRELEAHPSSEVRFHARRALGKHAWGSLESGDFD